MHLQVKYGLITLINQQADGCETIGKADLECPLEKGDMSMNKDVDLPREIPPVRAVMPPLCLRRNTDLMTGHLHRSRRRHHQGRQEDHLPDRQGPVPPVNASDFDAAPPAS
jgi:hypothetical protein